MKVVFDSERIITHIVSDDTVVKPGRSVPYSLTEQPDFDPSTHRARMLSPIGKSVSAEADTYESEWVVEPIPPHTVRKDTILMRIVAAGKVTEAMQVVENLTPENKFLFNNFDSFSSDNDLVRGFITQIGLDPDMILAAE